MPAGEVVGDDKPKTGVDGSWDGCVKTNLELVWKVLLLAVG